MAKAKKSDLLEIADQLELTGISKDVTKPVFKRKIAEYYVGKTVFDVSILDRFPVCDATIQLQSERLALERVKLEAEIKQRELDTRLELSKLEAENKQK